MKVRSCARFASAFWMLIVLAATLHAAQEAKYRVAPVYAPPLKRPPIQPSREKLPDGSSGRLPTFDGERFQVKPPARDSAQPGESDVRNLVNQVLQAIGWTRSLDEITAVDRGGQAREAGRYDEQAKQAIERTEREQSGRLGRLSGSTRDAIAQQANTAKADAERQQRVFAYEQRVDGRRVEGAGIQAVWQQGRGVASISGRVFNDVRMANQAALNEAQAVAAARSHVTRSTKLAATQPVGPELVILPYADAMRFAWRIDVAAVEGVYRLWIDAGSRAVLQLAPQFWAVAGTGRVFNPDPNGGTKTEDVEVNAASGGNFQLLLSGELDENNSGADGTTGDLSMAAGTATTANFDASPLNGTVVERTNQTGYNGRFQEVNAYTWIFSNMKLMESLGSKAFPSLTVTVNSSDPCGFGNNNACGGGSAMTFGIGQATVSTSTSTSDVFNSAIDATVVTHEFGHVLTGLQMSPNSPTAALSEGLSDFWAATVHNTAIFAAWWAHNSSTPVQTGFAPRQAEAKDVFPEHRAFSTDSHADGQIIDWALWSTREGLRKQGALGILLTNTSLLKALTTAGVGISGSSDQDVHESFLDLLEQLTTHITGTNAYKMLSGFARAGICLSERDAIIDISDDYLARSSTSGPTFTVFGGRDFEFSATESAVATTNFNTRFQVEVANDNAFTVNPVTSGWLTTIAVNTDGVPQATWTLPTTDWNTVKAGDRLFYRVTTTDGAGGNSRTSASPGNGFLTGLPPASALINESGECECTCSTAAPSGGTPNPMGFVTLLPAIIALIWRRRLRGAETCDRGLSTA